MPRIELLFGDVLQVNGSRVQVLFADSKAVLLELTTEGEFEVNPDEHPDEEVAASAGDPNAAGRTIGSRLPGGVR
jgi:hypothetical protein